MLRLLLPALLLGAAAALDPVTTTSWQAESGCSDYSKASTIVIANPAACNDDDNGGSVKYGCEGNDQVAMTWESSTTCSGGFDNAVQKSLATPTCEADGNEDNSMACGLPSGAASQTTFLARVESYSSAGCPSGSYTGTILRNTACVPSTDEIGKFTKIVCGANSATETVYTDAACTTTDGSTPRTFNYVTSCGDLSAIDAGFGTLTCVSAGTTVGTSYNRAKSLSSSFTNPIDPDAVKPVAELSWGGTSSNCADPTEAFQINFFSKDRCFYNDDDNEDITGGCQGAKLYGRQFASTSASCTANTFKQVAVTSEGLGECSTDVGDDEQTELFCTLPASIKDSTDFRARVDYYGTDTACADSSYQFTRIENTKCVFVGSGEYRTIDCSSGSSAVVKIFSDSSCQTQTETFTVTAGAGCANLPTDIGLSGYGKLRCLGADETVSDVAQSAANSPATSVATSVSLLVVVLSALVAALLA